MPDLVCPKCHRDIDGGERVIAARRRLWVARTQWGLRLALLGPLEREALGTAAKLRPLAVLLAVIVGFAAILPQDLHGWNLASALVATAFLTWVVASVVIWGALEWWRGHRWIFLTRRFPPR